MLCLNGVRVNFIGVIQKIETIQQNSVKSPTVGHYEVTYTLQSTTSAISKTQFPTSPCRLGLGKSTGAGAGAQSSSASRHWMPVGAGLSSAFQLQCLAALDFITAVSQLKIDILRSCLDRGCNRASSTRWFTSLSQNSLPRVGIHR